MVDIGNQYMDDQERDEILSRLALLNENKVIKSNLKYEGVF